MAIKLEVNFTDPESIPYKIEISDPSYEGTFIREVQGTAVLAYPKVDTMDMLRGSSLNMSLEASKDSNYYSFLYETVGDAVLPVTLYRSGVIFWKGFIKPDGIIESFVEDHWIIEVQAVDGLGYLENTQFLDSDNNVYTGSVKELDLLTRCLQLTGQEINFRLYAFNIVFSVSELSNPSFLNSAIIDTYVNTDRYRQKDEPQSVFTAKEVLESILKKYGAFVVQQDGKWNIVRLIDYFSEAATLIFREYDSDGVYTGVTENPDRINLLGSQINGFYPHHCNANQQKNYNASLGAYKVLYEYEAGNVIKNPEIRFNDTDGDIDHWNIVNGREDKFNIISDGSGGFVARWLADRDENYFVLQSTTFPRVDPTNALTIKSTVSFYIDPFISFAVVDLVFRVSVSLTADDGTVYYLTDNRPAEWTSDFDTPPAVTLLSIRARRPFPVTQQVSVNIDTNACPETGTLKVSFLVPDSTFLTNIVSLQYLTVDSFEIFGRIVGITGESFTARRTRTLVNGNKQVSTVVEVDENISVGDNVADIYLGGIENNIETNTVTWSKSFSDGTVDTTRRFPLLDWLVRDRLQISSGNALRFTGGVYGYLPFLGIVNISNFKTITKPVKNIVFMPVSWSYNLANNIIDMEMERIFVEDISSDTAATGRVFEGAIVVKPAIVSG